MVEHFLGKEEATGSIPVDGSIWRLIVQSFFSSAFPWFAKGRARARSAEGYPSKSLRLRPCARVNGVSAPHRISLSPIFPYSGNVAGK